MSLGFLVPRPSWTGAASRDLTTASRVDDGHEVGSSRRTAERTTNEVVALLNPFAGDAGFSKNSFEQIVRGATVDELGSLEDDEDL
jgi:hypothetical protein